MRNRLLLLVAALAGGVLGCGDDGGGSTFTGPTMTSSLDVSCTSDLVNMGNPFTIPLDITATLESDPVQGAANAVQLQASVSVGTDLVDLVVALNMGNPVDVGINTLALNVDVGGATPAGVTLSSADLPLNVVFAMGEVAVIETDVVEQAITLDNSGELSFTFADASLSMVISTLGEDAIPLAIPGQAGDFILCQLPDPNTPVTFAVP